MLARTKFICALAVLAISSSAMAKESDKQANRKPASANIDATAINAEIAQIKKAYNDCMKNADANVEMKSCTWDAYQAVDKELQKTYDTIQRGYLAAAEKDPVSKEANKRLTKAENGWIAFKEGQCNFQGMEMFGGTGAQLVIDGCLYDMTMQRLKDLIFMSQTSSN